MLVNGENLIDYCRFCGWGFPHEIIQKLTAKNKMVFCEYCGVEISSSSKNFREKLKHEESKVINESRNTIRSKDNSIFKKISRLLKPKKVYARFILEDEEFPLIFKENLIIVMSRLIYLFIREWEQIENITINRVGLSKSLFHYFASILNPICDKRINMTLLVNLFKLDFQEFEYWLKKLQYKIQNNQNYRIIFKIFLLWLTKIVFRLVSDMWNMKNLPKFQATILKDLKNYQYDEINFDDHSRNSKIKSGLHHDEEIIIKDSNGIVNKVRIAILENSWNGLKVLSVMDRGSDFGSPKFVFIKDFFKIKTSNLLSIQLADGRQILCSPDQTFPVMIINIRNKCNDSPINDWVIKSIKARDLNKGDNLLVLHKIPLSFDVQDDIFVPSFINWENRWVGVKRSEYLKFSYKKNQKTDDPLINLINSKFQYSKVAKIYRTIWSNLSNPEKQLIEKEVRNNRVEVLIKIHERVGYWNSSIVSLTNDFFRYLGWYTSEGSTDKNRVTISQSKAKHYNNWNEIINLLERLDYPITNNGRSFIRVNSNILMELTVKLCSKLAQKKRIPIEFLTNDRIHAFLDAFYKGDGGPLPSGLRRFSTTSRQLKNDLVSILGGIGKFCSIHNPSSSDACYRIVETEGKHYKRKFLGLLNFNNTTPVKVKSIRKIKNKSETFNIRTDNNWFVSTNGIIVIGSFIHN